ncbi:MAG: hypothetical protein M3O22_05260 [Pseudomonadota bacterium]|nr:hypothetical protein [Pseudomonadota bacterium]
MTEQKNQWWERLHWRLFFPILVLGLAGIAYTALRWNALYDSALLYLGIPLILALGFSLIPERKTAMGATMKGTTVALFLSVAVFQEGYICILFVAPLFYAVGALIAWQVDRARKRKGTAAQAAVLACCLAVLSLEGATDLTTFPRDNVVEVSQIIPADITQVREQLAKTPAFPEQKPFFLRIFPYPVHISGQGLEPGDERRAHFVAWKHIWWTKVEGDLVFQVAESTPGSITFRVVKDDTYISHYLKWLSSRVRLEAVDDSHTRVTWTHEYQRLLDPVWYFGPLQHYAVALTTEQLVRYVATPAGQTGS